MGFPTEKQKIGRIGEDIAARYLENKGFVVVEKNYRKKYGEIDIITQKGKILHFIEVKSVSCENLPSDVPRVTDAHRPEDNVHPRKLRRMANVIQAYLFSKYPKGQPEWVFDVVTVRLSMKTRQARVKFLENLIL